MEKNKDQHDIKIEVVRNDGSTHQLTVSSDIDEAYNNSYCYYYQCALVGAIKYARMIVDGKTMHQVWAEKEKSKLNLNFNTK